MNYKVATFSTLMLLIGTMTFAQLLNKRTPDTETETQDLSEIVSKLKADAKLKLEPFRYDGSKVTYFLYKPYLQRKEVEVYFFNDTEYKLAFNSNAVEGDGPLEVAIYDRPHDNKYRTKLFEKKGVTQSEFDVTSTQLLNALKEAKVAKGMSEAEANDIRLKKVYIDYIIPSKPREIITDEKGNKTIVRTKAAMVMAMGYSNI